MWSLRNRTAYAAERNWTRGKRGEHHWIVAVRTTFEVTAYGALRLADEQLPPVLAPEYYGDPGASSLKYESDLLDVKGGTDLLVLGSAHAAHGRAAQQVDVALRAGEIEKSLVVFGDRLYYRGVGGVAITRPSPFISRPLVYEFAYGGTDLRDPDPSRHRIDARNPIGKGFATRLADLVDQAAPSIEYPSGNPAERGPAGFGPIDRSWSPRRELAGTYDDAWAEKRRPLLPEDYDDRFALCAPADQRPAPYLRGGERVELTNMTVHGVLRFELPRLAFGFTTRFGSREEDHAGRLTSVIVEPDRNLLSLVWQSSLVVPARFVEHLDQTTIREKRYA